MGQSCRVPPSHFPKLNFHDDLRMRSFSQSRQNTNGYESFPLQGNGRYYELTLFVDKAYFACIRNGIVCLS
jgi:hypothetical protein